jgi:pimeloyl-ACP methyl ester carboxylesterase
MSKILFCFLLSCSAVAQIQYGNNSAAGNTIVLNGVKHYYEVYGEGKPLLLIHGNTTGIKGFEAQIKFFSPKFRIYAIENRGRGKSDLGEDSLTYDLMASDLSQFLDKLNLDSVSIIGKSDGGVVALIMGFKFPKRIHKIVSFAANLWPDSTALYGNTVRQIHNERVLAEKMLAAHDSSKNWKLQRQLYRLMEFHPHISGSDLQKIRAPVMVITGDRDLIVEEHSLFIYRNIPRSNLAVLPLETHHLPRKNPALFNETVMRYLASPYGDNAVRFEK